MMPHSPISRTDSGSVSAIKQFIFGGVLDASRHQSEDSDGECKRILKSQILKSQILKSQVLKPQIFRSQIIKTKIQRFSKYNSGTTCEDDPSFPNNLRSPGSYSSQVHSVTNHPVSRLNNLRSTSFRSTDTNLNQGKSSPQYGSTPNLSSCPSESGLPGTGLRPVRTDTLPRNFQARGAKHLRDWSIKESAPVPLPSSASSACSSCAHLGNTTFDSGFLSDSTCTETEVTDSAQENHGTDVNISSPSEKECGQGGECNSQVRNVFHQDNPTYGCCIVQAPLTPHNKDGSRKSGRQVSSVTLKIENGLFATVSKDSKTAREGRGRDRRPLDLTPVTLPPPPPGCIIIKKQKLAEEPDEATGGWKRATMTTSGTFLARCVKIEDL